MGVNDLEEHLRQKRLRWFGHIVRRDEEVEIKKVFELKIGRRKRGRSLKWWIDVVEEDRMPNIVGLHQSRKTMGLRLGLLNNISGD